MPDLASFLLGSLVGFSVSGVLYAWTRRVLEGQLHGETPWETSIDPDVEIRWKDGWVESRLRANNRWR